MEHEREFKGEQQVRVHGTGFPTEDGALSWAGGQQVISPGGPDFTTELAHVAGVNGTGLERSDMTPNPQPFSGLTTASLCVESGSGRAMNTQQLLLGGK